MAFEKEGFCVVRGPELLLGGDIRGWHAPGGRFDGVIGGPPCKAHSRACRGNAPTQENLIPEFERVVAEARPEWWLCENVPDAPVPLGAAFAKVLDAWEFGARQHRRRRFSSNLMLRPATVPPDDRPCVTATEHKHSAGSRNRRRAGRKVGRRMTLAEVNAAMGLPEDFDTPCLTLEFAYAARGNGVPLPMGVEMARAVKAALLDTETHPRCTTQRRGNVASCPRDDKLRLHVGVTLPDMKATGGSRPGKGVAEK